MLWARSELMSPAMNACVVAGLTCTAALWRLLPHGIFIHTYKDVHQAYKHSQPVGLPERLTELIEEVLTQLRVNTSRGGQLRYFCSSLSEPMHGGSAALRWGGIIGVPLSYTFTSHEHVVASGFTVGGRRVDWQSDAGRQLSSALLLSDAAQKFAVARETLCVVERQHVLQDGVLAAASMMLTYAAGVTLKLRARLLQLPRVGRAAVYGGVCLLGATCHVAAKDAIARHRDAELDETVGRLGVDWARGGIEFYEKLLRRNSAARELDELSGDKTSTYSTRGDVLQLFRLPHLPLTERMLRLRRVLDELQHAAASGEPQPAPAASGEQDELEPPAPATHGSA